MIKLNSISKSFYNDSKTKSSALSFLKDLFSNDELNKIHALNSVSFEIGDGEVVGLVGKNGSGKSTLLKVIAGIIKPTSGNLIADGTVVYLSGFYHGMNKNLSMRDNIYVIGTLNGLNRNEISEVVQKISDFSELGKFIDTPIYKFSNGMTTRLAFTTTIFTTIKSPDILLIDEAMGGGLDDSFKEKSMKKIKEYIDSAKVVIIASHNSNYILENCSKAIWIDGGEIKKAGNTQDIISEYRKFTQ